MKQAKNKQNVIAELIYDLLAQVQKLNSDVATVQRVLQEFLPRADGRPGYNSQFNLSDMSALRAGLLSAEFIEENLITCKVFPDRLHQIREMANYVNTDGEGVILEFGVGDGTSLRTLVQTFPNHRVYGFDSFQGLPEDWRTGFPEGAFSEVAIPFDVEATLITGWFDETLPTFLETCSDTVSLLHLDADLFSSTSLILDLLNDRLQVGTVIVFDEFFNYPGWKQHESLALSEFLSKSGRKIEYISYVPSHEELAIRIVA